MRVCLGGTFHPFHVGHEALLQRAAQVAGTDGEVFIGVTTAELAERPDRDVPPWQDRAATIESFLAGVGFRGHVVPKALTDGTGPAVTGDYEAIVVSEATVQGAERINAERTADGREPLAVHVVPFVLGGDLLPVSATRVAAGDIDRDGSRLTPVRVAVGSQNPVKVAAVEEELARLLAAPVAVSTIGAASGVPEQPRLQEMMEGARARAHAAMQDAADADYAVGVEAGLDRGDGETWYDVQACAVVDRAGLETHGWGPAFRYPDWVTKRALAGEMVSDILGPVARDPHIGGTTGAIGYLTDGRMDRRELTRIAVLMAFVPRFRRSLYLGPPDA